MHHLPHLLRLVDDDSPVVREAVARELFSHGFELPATLSRLAHPPNEEQVEHLHAILSEYGDSWLKQAWPGWMKEQGEGPQLEGAFTLLALYQNSPLHPTDLGEHLDELARQARDAHADTDTLTLAEWLFSPGQFHGEDENYYNPRSSDLVYVIEQRRGIPISLTAVYMLVGQRLSLTIRGCNVPGHFMGQVFHQGQLLLVDAYNQGAILTEEDVLRKCPETLRASREIFREPADPRTMMVRVLHNLENAYSRIEDHRRVRLVTDLREATQQG